MIQLDDNLIREMGLDELTAEDKERTLDHIYEVLEQRVGQRLTESMSDEQLRVFDGLISKQGEGGDAEAQKWIETNFPNYKDLVKEELEKIRDEVKASAPQILAAGKEDEASQGQATPN